MDPEMIYWYIINHNNNNNHNKSINKCDYMCYQKIRSRLNKFRKHCKLLGGLVRKLITSKWINFECLTREEIPLLSKLISLKSEIPILLGAPRSQPLLQLLKNWIGQLLEVHGHIRTHMYYWAGPMCQMNELLLSKGPNNEASDVCCPSTIEDNCTYTGHN